MVAVRHWQWLETNCQIPMLWWKLEKRCLCLLLSRTHARFSVRRCLGKYAQIKWYYRVTVMLISKYLFDVQSWGGWSNSSRTCSTCFHFNSFKSSWIKGAIQTTRVHCISVRMIKLAGTVRAAVNKVVLVPVCNIWYILAYSVHIVVHVVTIYLWVDAYCFLTIPKVKVMQLICWNFALKNFHTWSWWTKFVCKLFSV